MFLLLSSFFGCDIVDEANSTTSANAVPEMDYLLSFDSSAPPVPKSGKNVSFFEHSRHFCGQATAPTGHRWQESGQFHIISLSLSHCSAANH
jgi:hypothetical protein